MFPFKNTPVQGKTKSSVRDEFSKQDLNFNIKLEVIHFKIFKENVHDKFWALRTTSFAYAQLPRVTSLLILAFVLEMKLNAF